MIQTLANLYLKGNDNKKFNLSNLKEIQEQHKRSLLQNFYICFTLGDINCPPSWINFNLINYVLVTSQKG